MPRVIRTPSYLPVDTFQNGQGCYQAAIKLLSDFRKGHSLQLDGSTRVIIALGLGHSNTRCFFHGRRLYPTSRDAWTTLFTIACMFRGGVNRVWEPKLASRGNVPCGAAFSAPRRAS